MIKFNNFEKKAIVNSLKDLGAIHLYFEIWSENLTKYTLFFKHKGIIRSFTIPFEEYNNGLKPKPNHIEINNFIAKCKDILIEQKHKMERSLDSYKKPLNGINDVQFLHTSISSILNLCDYHAFFPVTVYKKNSHLLDLRIEELLDKGHEGEDIFKTVLEENNVDFDLLEELILSIEDDSEEADIFS